MQELQLRLKESCRERERLQKQHAGQLAAVGQQVQAQVAAFRSQQAQLRQEVERDLAAASGECLASYEAGVAALQGQLQRQAATAERHQGELAEQGLHLRSGMQQLLAALLAAEVPPLPEAAQAALLCEGRAPAPQQVQGALRQVAQAVAQAVERAEAAAVDSALAALEERLLPGGAPPARPPSPRKLLSPSKRQQEAAAAAAAATAQPPPSLEVSEGRLEALLARSQELLDQLAAGEAQVGQLRQQVVALEATVAGCTQQFAQVRCCSAGGWGQGQAVCSGSVQVCARVSHVR